MAGMGIGEAALLSAALGGGTSAIQGKDPLKGAVLGALGGAALGGIGSALGGAGGAAGAEAATALGSGLSAAPSLGAAGLSSGLGSAAGMGLSATPGAAAGFGLGGAEAASVLGSGLTASAPTAAGLTTTGLGATTSAAPSLLSSPTAWWQSLTPTQKMLYGGGAGLGLMALSNRGPNMPGQEPYTGPLSRFRYNPDLYRPAFQMASGGIADLGGELPKNNPTPTVMYMNAGGISDLGSYSDGGRMLKGPGDGMSDNIPATIAGKRPARLADGEFVVPADVVSHLGNGSTDAGAKQLYAMMDRVRSKRTGTKKQGRQINPEKFMPA